jgi:hypothetical protein
MKKYICVISAILSVAYLHPAIASDSKTLQPIRQEDVYIDKDTGFHYLKSGSSSSYLPRYCLISFSNKRGHLMTKDNKLECILIN